MADINCFPPCAANIAQPLPGQLPPGSNVAAIIAAAKAPDDTNIVEVDATANATPGVWTELFPASAAREGAAIQNKDAAAIIYFLESATLPAAGTQPGEIGVPVFPGYYAFDWVPKKRYFFRSTVASSKVAIKTW